MMKEAIKFSRLSFAASAIAAPTMLKPGKQGANMLVKAALISNKMPIMVKITFKKSRKK